MVRAEAYGINKDGLDQATTVAVKMLKGRSRNSQWMRSRLVSVRRRLTVLNDEHVFSLRRRNRQRFGRSHFGDGVDEGDGQTQEHHQSAGSLHTGW